MGPLIYAALALMAAVIFVALRYADERVRPIDRMTPRRPAPKPAKPGPNLAP